MTFSAPSSMPGGWCKSARSTGFHRRQSGQDVGEVFSNVDLQATAVLNDGVEDRALAPGFAVSYEQPGSGFFSVKTLKWIGAG